MNSHHTNFNPFNRSAPTCLIKHAFISPINQYQPLTFVNNQLGKNSLK